MLLILPSACSNLLQSSHSRKSLVAASASIGISEFGIFKYIAIETGRGKCLSKQRICVFSANICGLKIVKRARYLGLVYTLLASACLLFFWLFAGGTASELPHWHSRWLPAASRGHFKELSMPEMEQPSSCLLAEYYSSILLQRAVGRGPYSCPAMAWAPGYSVS